MIKHWPRLTICIYHEIKIYFLLHLAVLFEYHTFAFAMSLDIIFLILADMDPVGGWLFGGGALILLQFSCIYWLQYREKCFFVQFVASKLLLVKYPSLKIQTTIHLVFNIIITSVKIF